MFASTGEKLDQFERFHPDRMAQRILGMGDVMSLIETAERQFDETPGRPSWSASSDATSSASTTSSTQLKTDPVAWGRSPTCWA